MITDLKLLHIVLSQPNIGKRLISMKIKSLRNIIGNNDLHESNAVCEQ